jgi:hypothetical protein
MTALISYVTSVATAAKTESDAQADAAEARVIASVGDALTATAEEATVATTAAKAMAGAEAIATIAGAIASKLWVQVTAAAEQTFANSSIDASLTASNDAVDAEHTYVVVSIGVNLIASTAATGFALMREHSAINAMTTAQKDAINAATNNAAQAVKAAWQNVNNLQSRAASTFAGTGPGGFAMTFAGFTGWFDGGWFNWSGFADSFSSSIGSIADSFAGMYHSIIGNDAIAQQYYHDAYVNGPLGQTAESTGFYYWSTRGALAVATIAGTSAGALGAYQFATGSKFLVEGSGVWNIAQGRIGSGGILQIRPVGGRPIFRLDYHAFQTGGRRFLHLDFNSLNVKHFPWEQIAKWF